MLRLFIDSPRDCREDEEDVLEVSEGGRAVLAGVAAGVVLPLDFSLSFSAFSSSISFCKKQVMSTHVNTTVIVITNMYI